MGALQLTAPELGRWALLTSILLAAAAAGLSAAAGAGRTPPARRARMARAGTVVLGAASATLWTATIVLARALVGEDWSLVYVADHARRGTSGWYRLSALWGGMAGSLLWWTTLLSTTALVTAVLLGSRRRTKASWSRGGLTGASTGHGSAELEAGSAAGRVTAGAGQVDLHAVALLSLVVAGFATTCVVAADPFRVLAIPAIGGAGLQPILEHPAMLYHPPLLYTGLVCSAPAWALAVSAGLHRNRSALPDRRWLLPAWVLLVAGLATGANWAYVELGWGGFWAWDPIENSALAPWLVATAALHLPSRHGGAAAARVLLSALPFTLVAAGALMTRSGAAPSVHTFAEDPALTRWLAVSATAILLLTVASAAACATTSTRWAPRHESPGAGARRRSAVEADRLPTSRSASALVAATSPRSARWLLASAAAIVVVGTATPFVEQWWGRSGAVVEGSYFARTLFPLALAALCLSGVATSIPHPPGASGHHPGAPATWPRTRERSHADPQDRSGEAWPRGVGTRMGAAAGLGLAVAVAARLLEGWPGDAAATLGFACGATVLCIADLARRSQRLPSGGSDREHAPGPLRDPGGGTSPADHPPLPLAATVAHLGVAVLLAGVAGSMAASTATLALSPGETAEVGSYTFTSGGAVARDAAAPGSLPSQPTTPGTPAEVLVAVEVHDGPDLIAHLEPRLVSHPSRGRILAETALDSNPARDVQVALRDARDDGSVLVEVGVRPLAQAVWWGSTLLVAAGVIALAGSARRAKAESDQGPEIHGRPGGAADLPAQSPGVLGPGVLGPGV